VPTPSFACPEPSSCPELERAPRNFVLSGIHRRCKACGRPQGTDRATVLDRGGGRLWERAGHGKVSLASAQTPTLLEYDSQPGPARRRLLQDHDRACVCYDRASLTDMKAMMEHRKLPVITGIDRIEYPGGDEYVGELKDRQRHGKGIHIFSNGCKYLGHFWAGKMHGVGECIYRLGGTYRGEFYIGARQGHGRGTARTSTLQHGSRRRWKNTSGRGSETNQWAGGF
jgi:ribosomal protein S14